MILAKVKLFELLPVLDLSIQLKFRTLSGEEIPSLFHFSEEIDAMLLSSKTCKILLPSAQGTGFLNHFRLGF